MAERVRRFDAQVDTWFAPFRERPDVATAARILSGLGDHGLIWAIVTAVRARRPGARRVQSVKALAIAGIESSLINAAIKSAVRRPRPEGGTLGSEDNIVPLRAPRTSSFPSGHTLAAFCAATVLAEPDERLATACLFGTAGLVGVSRLQVGAHHASDVVGGACIGTALGLLGRRLL